MMRMIYLPSYEYNFYYLLYLLGRRFIEVRIRDVGLGFTQIEAVDIDIFHQIRFQVDLSGLTTRSEVRIPCSSLGPTKEQDTHNRTFWGNAVVPRKIGNRLYNYIKAQGVYRHSNCDTFKLNL